MKRHGNRTNAACSTLFERHCSKELQGKLKQFGEWMAVHARRNVLRLMMVIELIIAGRPVPELHGSREQAQGRSADIVEMSSQQNELEHSAPAQAETISTLGGGGESNAKAHPHKGTMEGKDKPQAGMDAARGKENAGQATESKEASTSALSTLSAPSLGPFGGHSPEQIKQVCVCVTCPPGGVGLCNRVPVLLPP